MPHGTATATLLSSGGDDPLVVVLFMDAFGPRPALFRIAQALAVGGRRVIVPDLFYRSRPYQPLNPQSVFGGGEDRARLGALLAPLDQAAVDEDVTALLDHAAGLAASAAPLATVGYCMGGRFSLTAASLDSRLGFAAVIHGGHLAPTSGDSAHRRDTLRGPVYVGVAEIDPSFDAAEEARLAAAFRDIGVDHVIETYAGAAHGFALNDLPVYDALAFDRHLAKLHEGLARARSSAAACA